MNYKNDFKQHLLIDLHKLLVPVVDVGGLFISRLILLFFNWVVFVMIGPFENLHVSIPFHRPGKNSEGPSRKNLTFLRTFIATLGRGMGP
jgi:hypothetical protein